MICLRNVVGCLNGAYFHVCGLKVFTSHDCCDFILSLVMFSRLPTNKPVCDQDLITVISRSRLLDYVTKPHLRSIEDLSCLAIRTRLSKLNLILAKDGVGVQCCRKHSFIGGNYSNVR